MNLQALFYFKLGYVDGEAADITHPSDIG